MCKDVRVKPILQWRPKEVRDARNMDCLIRKASGHEWSQPRREALWAAISKAMGARLTHDTSCPGCWTWSYRI
jgi:hypothetical protein